MNIASTPVIVSTHALEFEQGGIRFWLCTMKYQQLAQITYVASRASSTEEGAVQRLLNQERVARIRDFLLDGNILPSNVILNWTADEVFEFSENQLRFTVGTRMAQILDGQHRIEGIKEALKEKPELGEIQIPSVITKKLDTPKCAQIFLSINTEQKPVPKTLVYDLYKLVAISNKDFAIERASDIATRLNEDTLSPYQGYVKFPKDRGKRGGIQLSTIVSSLKPLVKSEGEFAKFGVRELDHQAKMLINYFSVFKEAYGTQWESVKVNPFLFAAGLNAAMELLSGSDLLGRCSEKKDFTKAMFASLLPFDRHHLVQQSLAKGLSGKEATRRIKEELQKILRNRDHQPEESFKF